MVAPSEALDHRHVKHPGRLVATAANLSDLLGLEVEMGRYVSVGVLRAEAGDVAQDVLGVAGLWVVWSGNLETVGEHLFQHAGGVIALPAGFLHPARISLQT